MLPFEQPEIIEYSHHLANSYQRWTGRALITPFSPEALYRAPFVLVSHGTEADPIFRYANEAAQTLWKMDWDQFIKLPSRLSAEADAREERERLLKRAETQGYVDDYQGVRVTSDGKRFKIKRCLLWNVVNKAGDKIGQAATFSEWERL